MGAMYARVLARVQHLFSFGDLQSRVKVGVPGASTLPAPHARRTHHQKISAWPHLRRSRALGGARRRRRATSTSTHLSLALATTDRSSRKTMRSENPRPHALARNNAYRSLTVRRTLDPIQQEKQLPKLRSSNRATSCRRLLRIELGTPSDQIHLSTPLEVVTHEAIQLPTVRCSRRGFH